VTTVGPVACIAPLQDELDINSRPLIELCGILFASGRQLQRLDVWTSDRMFYVPCKLIIMVSVTATLESLTMILPENRNVRTLAGTLRSLQNLKVQSAVRAVCNCVHAYHINSPHVLMRVQLTLVTSICKTWLFHVTGALTCISSYHAGC
jgi:hypothetical protein